MVIRNRVSPIDSRTDEATYNRAAARYNARNAAKAPSYLTRLSRGIVTGAPALIGALIAESAYVTYRNSKEAKVYNDVSTTGGRYGTVYKEISDPDVPDSPFFGPIYEQPVYIDPVQRRPIPVDPDVDLTPVLPNPDPDVPVLGPGVTMHALPSKLDKAVLWDKKALSTKGSLKRKAR